MFVNLSASSGSGSEFSYQPPSAPPPSAESRATVTGANKDSDRMLIDDRGMTGSTSMIILLICVSFVLSLRRVVG